MERQPLFESEAEGTARLEAEGSDEPGDGCVPGPVQSRRNRGRLGAEDRGQKTDVRRPRNEERRQKSVSGLGEKSAGGNRLRRVTIYPIYA